MQRGLYDPQPKKNQSIKTAVSSERINNTEAAISKYAPNV